MTGLVTRKASATPDVTAPDGSEVRLLATVPRGSMASFTLPAGAVARAVVHRSVEELWYFIRGAGEMWRKLGDDEVTIAVGPGVSINIPTGAYFQFRAGPGGPLEAVGVTMPPWPGEEEAVFVPGPWEPKV